MLICDNICSIEGEVADPKFLLDAYIITVASKVTLLAEEDLYIWCNYDYGLKSIFFWSQSSSLFCDGLAGLGLYS